MRQKLPDRRRAIVNEVLHKSAAGTEEKYLISYGFDEEFQVREVFCADPRIGSDIHALLTDGCILISYLPPNRRRNRKTDTQSG